MFEKENYTGNKIGNIDNKKTVKESPRFNPYSSKSLSQFYHVDPKKYKGIIIENFNVSNRLKKHVIQIQNDRS